VGFSSREASKISLFSTVEGGGLLGRGALDLRCRMELGRDGGLLCGEGLLLAIGDAGIGAASTGDGIFAALGSGFLVPGGAEGALSGTTWYRRRSRAS
jgi:hypothetical protein